MTKFPLLLIAAFGWQFALPAQQDPTQAIQELARRIDEQMREIDRLLLETSKPTGGQQTPKELLQKSRAESEAVRQTIDELIQKLNEMKQQGQGSGESDQQQQQQQQQQDQQQPQEGQQGQGRQQNRRDGTSPEFAPQNRNQQGEDQQQGQEQQGKDQGQQPQRGQQPSGDANPAGGENRPGQAPPDQGTAPGQPGTGVDEWGELQPYMNFLKNRGSPPKVQEKYRKFWEAYLKAKPDRQ